MRDHVWKRLEDIGFQAAAQADARIAASRGPHHSKQRPASQQTEYASLEIVKVLLDARANVNEAELVGCGETMS